MPLHPHPFIAFTRSPWAKHWALGLVCFAALAGCNRGFYRRTADRDAYCIVAQKGSGPTYQVEPQFTIEADRRSRFYDPTCLTDPRLPNPAPQLYAYDLPELVTAAPQPRQLGDTTPDQNQALNPTLDAGTESSNPPAAAPRVQELVPPPQPQTESLPLEPSAHARSNSGVVPASAAVTSAVVTTARPIGLQSPETAVKDEPNPSESDLGGAANTVAGSSADEKAAALLDEFGQDVVFATAPVPASAWESLPPACVRRMLEFESVRIEFVRSFGQSVTESQLDPADRVGLENILEVALINSREYQTQKERLYRAALGLSLQQFDYDIKFLRGGNGSGVNYTHNRTNGIEVNSLRVPSSVGLSRSLYTAGELVARVANDVVLTFNGAGGYSSRVGSEIVIDLFQPLIQRDIRFEPLTQAERDVVYAAREFVRFRKQLFSDLAVQYYSLLLTYRSIEINTQDYFSNLGGFNRSAAYYRTGRISSVQVDQFEQNSLRSRGNLINSCNNLERSLDRLKLRVGLPPELPLNLDLSELNDLTRSDEATVIREQIRRTSKNVYQSLDDENIPGAVAKTTELARRMLSLSVINEELGVSEIEQVRELEFMIALLEAEDKRIEAKENASVLNSDASSDLLLPQVFLRKQEVIDSTLKAIQQELKLLELAIRDAQNAKESEEEAEDAKSNAERAAQSSSRNSRRLLTDWTDSVAQFEQLLQIRAKMPYEERSLKLPQLIEQADVILVAVQKLERQLVAKLASYGIELQTDESGLQALIEMVVERSEADLRGTNSGLTPLEVDVDEAMLTALVQRLDLMNQRGLLADEWRQVKFTADNLRSVLNINARQSIRTPAAGNNPLDFSFDDSTTTLGLEFDSPLNRRIERNRYRNALINYNAALRNLLQAEDNVKLSIRDDLRDIELDQNQYEISVSSAALAYERVNSTRFQLATGQGNVSARDFLEAQQAYTESLSNVAQQHIGYIVDRIQFFLDLEQMQVDDVLFWPDLRNEEYPFAPNLNFAETVGKPYGSLSCGPWYSDCLKRMEQVPAGVAMSRRPPSNPSQVRELPPPGEPQSPATPATTETAPSASNANPTR